MTLAHIKTIAFQGGYVMIDDKNQKIKIYSSGLPKNAEFAYSELPALIDTLVLIDGNKYG